MNVIIKRPQYNIYVAVFFNIEKMKKLYLVVGTAVTFLFLTVSGKGIKEMYISRTVGEDSIYHILSQNMPSCKKGSGEKLKPMEYDYTYVRRTDSVAMLMSVRLPTAGRNVEVAIAADDSLRTYPTELIYVNPKGNNYEYRLRIMMPFEEFETMYKDTGSPFSVNVEYVSDGSIRNICFGYDPKKWKSKYTPMKQIIEIIKLNCQKL